MTQVSALDFLRECHKRMGSHFDNSSHIPVAIQEVFPNIDHASQWRAYLKHKFRFLSLDPSSPERRSKKILEILHHAEAEFIAEFVPDWEAARAREMLAYYCRISQLQPALVAELWYDRSIQTLHDWCDARSEDLKRLDSSVREGIWPTANGLPALGQGIVNFQNDWSLSRLARSAMNGISKRVTDLQQTLAEFRPKANLSDMADTLTTECQAVLSELHTAGLSPDVPAPAGWTGSDQGFLVELCLKLMQTLYSEGFDLTALLYQFLQELKKQYVCEICDFLDVEDDGKTLAWRAATVDHGDLSDEFQELDPGDIRARVRKEESYARGVGITGCALLVEENLGRDVWMHLGSNDVQNDPRQSEQHRSAYEGDMYPNVLKAAAGRIANFWMFPIYSNSRLVGVFRVVNRLNATRELREGGWSYIERVELGVIANWFGRFLETATPQLQDRNDYVEVLERNKRIDELRANLELDWVPRPFIRVVLRHLSADINKREEKRRVGCCITIAHHPDGMPILIPELAPYPLLDPNVRAVRPPYNALDNYHDAVDPLLGTYVFNDAGGFERIGALLWNVADAPVVGRKALEAITKAYAQSLCLLLGRESKCVEVFSGGTLAARIHISERSGEWQFLYPSTLLSHMEKAADFMPAKVVETVWKTCLDMSTQGLGALFVLGDIEESRFRMGRSKLEIEGGVQSVVTMGERYLIEFAKLDGATFIGADGCVTRVNSIVRSNEPAERKVFDGRGGRHQAAEEISAQSPEVVVVVVSENKGISVLKNCEIVGSA
jgi:DNA integrity scanning protein DisA with diadenylate cyclase activity